MRAASLVLVSAALAVAGCAKKTQDIGASYVSTQQYDSYLCSQLRDEATRTSRRAGEVFGEQNMKSSVGAVIYWPTALVRGTAGARDAEVGRLKGQMAAIEQTSNAKNCGIIFQHAGATPDLSAAPQYNGGRIAPELKAANVSSSVYNAPRIAPQR